MTDVTIVAVNFHSEPPLVRCLRSVLDRSGGLDIEILVVNNGSDNGSIERLQEHVPSAAILGTGQNIGFGAGVNVGLARSSSPWILILNPDTEMVQGDLPGFIAGASDPSVAVAGPRTVRPDGSLQFSQRRFASLGGELAEALFLHRLADVGRQMRGAEAYSHPGSPDWVAGAVMLLRAEAAADVGPFDERFFLYREEADWCLRARRLGWQIGFVPGVTFVHKGGDWATNPVLFATYVESHRRFMDKHLSRSAALARKGVLAAHLSIRALGFTLAAWIGNGRRESALAYRAGLRQLWRKDLALDHQGVNRAS